MYGHKKKNKKPVRPKRKHPRVGLIGERDAGLNPI